MNEFQRVDLVSYLFKKRFRLDMFKNAPKATSMVFERETTWLTIYEERPNKAEIILDIKWNPPHHKDDDLEKNIVAIYNEHLPKTFVEVKYM